MNGDRELRRFVLLRHELPASSNRPSHDDLMLEREEDLFTLELLEALVHGQPLRARELAPHRKAYLDYEGPISQVRGTVRRLDRGALTILTWTEEAIEAELDGELLRGRLTLARETASEDGQIWRAELRVSR